MDFEISVLVEFLEKFTFAEYPESVRSGRKADNDGAWLFISRLGQTMAHINVLWLQWGIVDLEDLIYQVNHCLSSVLLVLTDAIDSQAASSAILLKCVILQLQVTHLTTELMDHSELLGNLISEGANFFLEGGETICQLLSGGFQQASELNLNLGVIQTPQEG